MRQFKLLSISERLIRLDHVNLNNLWKKPYVGMMKKSIPQDERVETSDSENKTRRFLLISDGFTKPVGFIVYTDFGPCMYIDLIVIDKQMQGKGLGRKTLNAFIKQFSVSSEKPLVVRIGDSNSAPYKKREKFYKNSGFKFIDQGTLVYPLGCSEDILDTFQTCFSMR